MSLMPGNGGSNLAIILATNFQLTSCAGGPPVKNLKSRGLSGKKIEES